MRTAETPRVAAWLMPLMRVISTVVLISMATVGNALVYPSASVGCGTTLQACIDAAPSGDTVEIATNTPVAEFVTIDKSLTLRSAAGFNASVQSVFVTASTVSANVSITTLTITFGIRALLQPGGANLTITVRDNTVSGSQNSAISVADNFTTGNYGQLVASIDRNRVSQTDNSSNCANAISFAVFSASAAAATIANNEISATDLSQCGGVEVYGGSAAGANVVVSRNSIRGSNFNNGILVRSVGADLPNFVGVVNATIANNLVAGQNGNVGAPGGIVLHASGNGANVAGSIVNNTVVAGRNGISISARTDLGSTVTARVANNLVANNTVSGIRIDTALSGVTNSHNLIFGNASNDFIAGAGTRTGDPAFVDVAAGNFALSANSDAVDRGFDGALPASFAIDLAGNPRRQGASIDIGAYESSFVVVVARDQAVPASTVGGLLALMIGLIAAAAVSRRAGAPH